LDSWSAAAPRISPPPWSTGALLFGGVSPSLYVECRFEAPEGASADHVQRSKGKLNVVRGGAFGRFKSRLDRERGRQASEAERGGLPASGTDARRGGAAGIEGG